DPYLSGGTWTEGHRILPDGKEVVDDDLRKPSKEALKTPLACKFIEFAGPEYKMTTNIKLYGGITNPEDHLSRFASAANSGRWPMPIWCRMFQQTLDRPAKGEPHEITKIERRANESLTAFKERWTVKTGFIIGLLEVMKILSFMDSLKCPELAKRFLDKAPTTVTEMMRRGRDNVVPFRGRVNRPPYSLTRGEYQARVAPILTLDTLTKHPKEILATETYLRLAPPRPMMNPQRGGNMDRFYDYHQEKGHHSNDCHHLQRELEAALESDKSNHLIRDSGDKARLKETQTDLVGFAGEATKPLGKIELEVCFGSEGLCKRTTMKFTVIRSHSPYNVILGRTGLRALRAIPSTIHSIMKFPTPRGIAALVTSSVIISECRRLEKKQLVEEEKKGGDSTFHSQIKRNLESDVDDMVIKSNDEKMLLVDMAETFDNLRRINIKLNPKKCSFRVEEDKEMQNGPSIPHSFPLFLKETLYAYLSVSKEAVSSALLTERKGKKSPIQYVSRTLNELAKSYAHMEKLTLSLVYMTRRLRRYFEAHPVKVITDQPIKQILNKTEASGKLERYAIKLGAYNITFEPRNAVKGQITPERDDAKEWALFTDGASSSKGSGSGLVLIGPSGIEHTYALRLTFDGTNNEAEYEALLAGLRFCHTPKQGLDEIRMLWFGDIRTQLLTIKDLLLVLLKLRDMPKGVLVLSGLSRVWKRHLYDPVLQDADGNVMGIHDFLCLPEWTGTEFQEEPHLDVRSTLQRLPFYCTPPATVDAVIPDPAPKDLAVGTPSSKIVAVSPKITEYQLADMFTKALSEDRFKYLIRRIGDSDDESVGDDDACVEIQLVTPLCSAAVIPPSGNQGWSFAVPATEGSNTQGLMILLHLLVTSFPFLLVLIMPLIPRMVLLGTTIVDQFATPREMVRVESLFNDQLAAKMSVLHRMMMSHGGELLARYRRLNQSYHEYVSSAYSRLKGYDEKSKAKGKERKKKIKSLTKSLDNLHSEVARLFAALNQATILEAERDEEILRLKNNPSKFSSFFQGQFQGLV
nr:reverse transcriptase domain-containing protein [Tanacetum cinerariifolium]